MKGYFSKIFTIFILVLLVIFAIKNINFYELYSLLKIIKPLYLLLAVSSYLIYFLLWAVRWEYLFKRVFRVEYFFLLKVVLAGVFFNIITPGAGVGGEPFRAYFLSKKYKKSKNKMLGVVLADKIFHLAVMGFFAIFSILFILIYVRISDNLKIILEILLISVLLAVSLALFLILKKMKFNMGVFFKKIHFLGFIKKRFKNPDDFEKYVNQKTNELSGIIRKIVKKKRNIFVGIFLSFCILVLEFFVSYFFFLSFGQSINFLIVVIVVSLGLLVGILSLSPGGVGVVETVMTLLYSAMGVNPILALLISLLSRMVYYFYGLLIGGLCLLNLRSILKNQ